jgi:putative membrane protein
MAVVIPEDFSACVTAGMTDEPKQATVLFFKNVRKNYVLASFSSKIENVLKDTVNDEIGGQYAEAIADGLIDAETGFTDAAEGAQKLQDGTSDLADGTDTLNDALAEADSGAQSIITGMDSLCSGAERLSDGTNSLANGTKELNDGVSELPSVTQTLSDGIGAVLSGISSIKAQTPTLLVAGEGVRDGLIALKTPIQEISIISNTISDKSKEASDACLASANLSGNTSADIQSAIDILTNQGFSEDSPVVQLLQKAKAESEGARTYSLTVATGLFSADPSAQTLYAAGVGIGQYASGIDAKLGEQTDTAESQTFIGAVNSMNSGFAILDSGLSDANTTLIKINEGAVALSEKSVGLVDAVAEIGEGAIALSEKTPELASGISELSSGVNALSDGLTELQDGASSLSRGAREIESGVSELKNGLDEGGETLSDALVVTPDAIAEYIVQPVDVKDSAYGDLEYFGFGFAPFFMTLSLWLGALLIFFIFEPFPSTAELGTNRFRSVFGRWPLYFTMMALEIMVVAFVATCIGIPYTSLLAFLLMFACIGFTFTCIMQFLSFFGLPGKAIALLLLIAQFVGSSGTLPVELGNQFVIAISRMLPFTYAIDGFREIMSGSNVFTAYLDMWHLLIFAAIAIALTLICYPKAWKAKHKCDEV